MNMIGYAADFEALINRYLIFISAEAVLLLAVLLMVWLVPYKSAKAVKHSRNKTARKMRLEKENRRKTLAAQTAVSVLIVVAGILLLNENISTVSKLNKDIEDDAFIVYEGEAVVSDSHSRLLVSDMIINNYIVELENSGDVCFIDMKATETPDEISVKINGRITYGENSKFILKIE